MTNTNSCDILRALFILKTYKIFNTEVFSYYVVSKFASRTCERLFLMHRCVTVARRRGEPPGETGKVSTEKFFLHFQERNSSMNLFDLLSDSHGCNRFFFNFGL